MVGKISESEVSNFNVVKDYMLLAPSRPTSDEAIVTVSQLARQPNGPTGASAIQLQPPQAFNQLLNAETKEQVGRVLLAVLDDLEGVQSIGPKLLGIAELATEKVSGRISSERFDIELALLISQVSTEKNELDVKRIQQVREENIEKIQQNQDKMAESLKAATEAKKSGLVAKIFGWISAIASIIVGVVLCATGVGAAAGALMIAGGVVGVVSSAVQQAAQDGLISEAAMKVLGPVLMATEIIVALVSVVVTFGGAAAGAIAKLAGKVAAKVSGKVGELAAGAAAKAGSWAAKTTDVASKSLIAAGVSKVVVDTGDGISKAVNSGMEAEAGFKAADATQTRSELNAGEALIKRFVAEFAPSTEAFAQALELILQMINANAESKDRILSRV